jgi:hypothetical protein
MVASVATLLVGVVILMLTYNRFPFLFDIFSIEKNTVVSSSPNNTSRDSDDIRILTGTVTAINGTSITIHTISDDSFEGSVLADRIIFVNASTTITKFIQKDLVVFQDEMAKFRKTTQMNASSSAENTQSVTPPLFFNLTTTNFASIKVGDILNVVALENIKLIKEFTASEIRFQSPPPQPK